MTVRGTALEELPKYGIYTRRVLQSYTYGETVCGGNRSLVALDCRPRVTASIYLSIYLYVYRSRCKL